jgi:hypothetical protein
MRKRPSLVRLALATALIGIAAAPAVQANPRAGVGSCSEAVVTERHYGQPQAGNPGPAVEEVYLSLNDGRHLDGPAELGTTGFFWDYTPGHRVGVCVEATKPSRLRVTDRETGASFLTHPSGT